MWRPEWRELCTVCSSFLRRTESRRLLEEGIEDHRRVGKRIPVRLALERRRAGSCASAKGGPLGSNEGGCRKSGDSEQHSAIEELRLCDEVGNIVKEEFIQPGSLLVQGVARRSRARPWDRRSQPFVDMRGGSSLSIYIEREDDYDVKEWITR